MVDVKQPLTPSTSSTDAYAILCTVQSVDLSTKIATGIDQLGNTMTISLKAMPGRPTQYPQSGEVWVVTRQFGDWMFAASINATPDFQDMLPASPFAADGPVIMKRDDNGRSEVENPTSSLQIANKTYVDSTISSNLATTGTSSPTPNTLVRRDANGTVAGVNLAGILQSTTFTTEANATAAGANITGNIVYLTTPTTMNPGLARFNGTNWVPCSGKVIQQNSFTYALSSGVGSGTVNFGFTFPVAPQVTMDFQPITNNTPIAWGVTGINTSSFNWFAKFGTSTVSLAARYIAVCDYS